MQYMQNWMLNLQLSSGNNIPLKYLGHIVFKCFSHPLAIQLRLSSLMNALLIVRQFFF